MSDTDLTSTALDVLLTMLMMFGGSLVVVDSSHPPTPESLAVLTLLPVSIFEVTPLLIFHALSSQLAVPYRLRSEPAPCHSCLVLVLWVSEMVHLAVPQIHPPSHQSGFRIKKAIYTLKMHSESCMRDGESELSHCSTVLTM